MDKLIYLPIALFFLGGLLMLNDALESPSKTIELQLRSEKGQRMDGQEQALANDTLFIDTKADLLVLDRKSQLYWEVETPLTKEQLVQNTPVYIFNHSGTYTIHAFDGMRKVASRSVYVAETEKAKIDLIAKHFTSGEEVRAFDASTVKVKAGATKRWTLTDQNNSDVVAVENEDTFTWLSGQSGNFTLNLAYLDDEGAVLYSASESLSVNPKPVAKPKPAPAPAAKPATKAAPTEAELLAQKQRKEEAERKRLEAESKKREAAEQARANKEAEAQAELDKKSTPPEKPKTESPSSCWYKADKGGASFKAGPPVPAKRESVEFKSGMTVFTIEPKADIALTDLSFWGNSKTGNVTLTMECKTCKDDNVQKLRPVTFVTGFNFEQAQTKNVSTRMGFLKGHTYKIIITTQEGTEMGFGKLEKKDWDDPMMTIKFETAQTPVYGLTFQKR